MKKVAVQGTILSIDLKSTDQGYQSGLKHKIYPYFLERNILLRPLGNVIYLNPPYVIEQKDLERVYQEIERFMELI